MPASLAGTATPGSARKRKRAPDEEPPLTEMLEERLGDSVLVAAVKDIVEKLCQNPQKILYAQVKVSDDSLLPSAKIAEEVVAAGSRLDRPFSDDYKCLEKIPKDYVRFTLLPVLEPKIFDDPDKLKDAEKHTPGSIKGLFFQALAVRECTKWVKQGKRRDVFMAAAMSLYAARGRRLKDVVFQQDDKKKWYIDWKVSGVYKLLPPKGQKKEIQHISGFKQPIGDEITVKDTFSISKPWHEGAAVLDVGKLDQTIAKMFPESFTSTFWSGRGDGVTAAFIEAFGQVTAQEGGADEATPEAGEPVVPAPPPPQQARRAAELHEE